MSFETLLGLASVALATIAATVALVAQIAAEKASRRQRRTLEGISVNAVLGQATLKSVGDLIVRDLGSTSMPNYVRDVDMRVRFRHAFNAARGFLAEPAESASDARPLFAPGFDEQVRFPPFDSRGLTPEGASALMEIQRGESWNALARMRRILERELVRALGGNGEMTRKVGAGQLLAVAEKSGLIASDEARRLRFATSVANRAIHGEDVTADEAVEAVWVIDRFAWGLRGPTVD